MASVREFKDNYEKNGRARIQVDLLDKRPGVKYGKMPRTPVMSHE